MKKVSIKGEHQPPIREAIYCKNKKMKKKKETTIVEKKKKNNCLPLNKYP